jgi:hypothetical protein
MKTTEVAPNGMGEAEHLLELQERKESIARAAYLIAENRGFASGREIDDWLQAEAEFNHTGRNLSTHADDHLTVVNGQASAELNSDLDGIPVEMGTLTIDYDGMICDCDHDGEALFKCQRDEMIEHHVSTLLPQLVELDVVRDSKTNSVLRFCCRVGHHFAAVARNSETFVAELFLNILDNTGHGRVSVVVRPVRAEVSDERPSCAEDHYATDWQ